MKKIYSEFSSPPLCFTHTKLLPTFPKHFSQLNFLVLPLLAGCLEKNFRARELCPSQCDSGEVQGLLYQFLGFNIVVNNIVYSSFIFLNPWYQYVCFFYTYLSRNIVRIPEYSASRTVGLRLPSSVFQPKIFQCMCKNCTCTFLHVQFYTYENYYIHKTALETNLFVIRYVTYRGKM